jgi:hypothetical protein
MHPARIAFAIMALVVALIHSGCARSYHAYPCGEVPYCYCPPNPLPYRQYCNCPTCIACQYLQTHGHGLIADEAGSSVEAPTPPESAGEQDGHETE